MLIFRMHKVAPIYKPRIEFWLTLNVLLANAAPKSGSTKMVRKGFSVTDVK